MAGHPLTCWWKKKEAVPAHHFLFGGSQDTGGPGRAGTAAAEGQSLGQTGVGEERGGQGGTEGNERGEEGLTAVKVGELGPQGELEGEEPPFGCQWYGSGLGEREW